MQSEKLPAVFDCMIYLQAAISEKSPAAELFRQVERGNVLLFVSNEILEEIRTVFTRPKVLLKYSHLTVESIEDFLNRVLGKANLINKIPNHFTLSRDPKDEKYINLAVEAEAHYIVSRDNDLLDLMTDYAAESKAFRQKFRWLKVVAPGEFLRIVQENHSPSNP